MSETPALLRDRAQAREPDPSLHGVPVHGNAAPRWHIASLSSAAPPVSNWPPNCTRPTAWSPHTACRISIPATLCTARYPWRWRAY
jgi:hypothetical protein